MRLWRKAKLYGWNPDEVDFGRDREDWLALEPHRRERLLQLCALFHAAEESVTTHLVPLLRVVAAEGRREEEIYLTSFLSDEAKHIDVFDRFFAEVAGSPGELPRYLHPSYRRIVDEELPAALRRLDTDASPEAQVRASVTYHLMVEGVMGETGFLLFDRILGREGIMPGMREVVRLIRRDESRHIGYGVYLVSRLVAEHGDRAYRAFLARMGELKPLVEDSAQQYAALLEGPGSFEVDLDELTRHSQERTAGRLQRIVRARTQSPQELGASLAADEDEPAARATARAGADARPAAAARGRTPPGRR
jgi:ribonucleoside-diphosphate reductase beta chain